MLQMECWLPWILLVGVTSEMESFQTLTRCCAIIMSLQFGESATDMKVRDAAAMKSPFSLVGAERGHYSYSVVFGCRVGRETSGKNEKLS